MSSNTVYVARMTAQFRKWDADFHALATQGVKTGAAGYHEAVKALRYRRDTADRALEAIRFSSESAGAQMRAGMDAAWAALRTGLDTALSDFRK